MAQRESTNITFTIESARLTAQEIEQRVGLKPDVSWLSGAERGAFGARAKAHGFVLESTNSPTEPFDNHLKGMIARLSPFAQKIGALGNDLDIEFVCSLHRRTAPAVEISRDNLRWLGVMGARLKLDIQIVGDQPKGAAAAPPGPQGFDQRKP